MLDIKIIRAAVREIQKLPQSDLQRVNQILCQLSQRKDRDTKKLKGYDDLLRTRSGDVRVIWYRENKDVLLVIKAGRRDKIYDRAFDSLDRTDPQTLEQLLNLEGTHLSEKPSYQWNQEEDEAWSKFIYGGYRYSPKLTPHQRNILNDLLKPLSSPYKWTNSHRDRQAWVIQSAPGTGKTLCATLLGCEINQHYGCNTIIIVPEALRQDIAEYSEVKQGLKQPNFRLNTFHEWLGSINSTLGNIASQADELQALRTAARTARMSGKRNVIPPEEITKADVLLYQAFILDETNQNYSKNSLFKLHESRINTLRQIKKSSWDDALKEAGKLCRLDTANRLRENIPAPPGNEQQTVIIIDEAQDFLLAELNAVVALCKEWSNQEHPTYLWLLGDLNQRIQPTDFAWGQLHLDEPIKLQINYRNSRQILQFANLFWQLAKQDNDRLGGKAKYLPDPANCEDAFEIGDRVQLLECANEAEAIRFLEELARQSACLEKNRYLIHKLTNTVKVLSHNLSESPETKNLIILNAERAKGREFEACVAFRLFAGHGNPTLEEALKWYTMLTRARSRLLVVATSSDLARIGRNYFNECERIDSQTAINWITEIVSDVDLSQIIDDVKQRLLERCETGNLYWDSYTALELAGVKGNELYEWEKEAIKLLRQHSVQHLNSELQIAQNISLRCLILRAMDKSWQAVSEAANLKNRDYQEYNRLIENIAKDLEAKNLPYEAARIRQNLGAEYASPDLPFWEEVNQTSNQGKPLVNLLCQAFISRFS